MIVSTHPAPRCHASDAADTGPRVTTSIRTIVHGERDATIRKIV
jgi:hypothetical protein